MTNEELLEKLKKSAEYKDDAKRGVDRTSISGLSLIYKHKTLPESVIIDFDKDGKATVVDDAALPGYRFNKKIEAEGSSELE
jgi:hypothetical protein